MAETLFGVEIAAPDTLARHPLPGEDLFGWLTRTTGTVSHESYAQILGAANAYKEGDAAIGVAAADDETREMARGLLSATTLGAIDAHPLFDDRLSQLLESTIDVHARDRTSRWTLGALKQFLVSAGAAAIGAIMPGLSSEVIACVVKLLSNDELVSIGATIFNILPGSRIGADGYLGARLQPNSPTDHPDDIRWQVFCGWSYGVGDVLLGTNPVSSDPASVLRVERTLQDCIRTFGLEQALPHCVLSHIDVQAAIEQQAPGSTALWFQSIAGSDDANQTFDVTVEKMLAHADARSGRFGLYMETGQGADFTNGHGRGVDMVMHEARKYGFARALTARVAQAQEHAGHAHAPWLIVNDVAGFIGPEVFRTREQLMRCCLEDLVMGKLHGLTIGLDVCATLHMDISLDDLDWCLQQVMPAAPAYLMALPTKIDPMLGYLTTGFHDHVRLRADFAAAVNPPMQAFFQAIGVLDGSGKPGNHFGDPVHVYIQYQRRRGDARTDDALREEAQSQIAQVRARGVFISEGHGARADDLAEATDHAVRMIYDDAKLAFWATLPLTFADGLPDAIVIETRSSSREDYILHPTTGEALSTHATERVAQLRAAQEGRYNAQLVLSDGLNALALTEPSQLAPFLDVLRASLASGPWRLAPETVVVTSGRVRAGYRIGETLFEGRRDRCAIVHVVGERPGTGHHTFSAYVTVAEGAVWSEAGRVDHDTTKVVSGIALTATVPEAGAGQVARLLEAWW